jgi:hypothetical protein
MCSENGLLDIPSSTFAACISEVLVVSKIEIEYLFFNNKWSLPYLSMNGEYIFAKYSEKKQLDTAEKEKGDNKCWNSGWRCF